MPEWNDFLSRLVTQSAIMQTSIIPEQKEGKHNDLAESRSFPDKAAAADFFDLVASRLLQPGQWSALAGAGSAAFELVDHSGMPLAREARQGDYLKIDLPGPGSVSGEGYDWVRVDEIERKGDAAAAQALLAMRVVACQNPTGTRQEAAAHFFVEGASSTFELLRKDNTVSIAYHGRNEVPNTDTGSIADNLRNAITGTLAVAGISELQWTALLKGMLADD
jgi:hypothetical protein